MKSHVSICQHQCPVCGELHDSGEILLDKRMRDSLEERTVTGWGLCPEHRAIRENGYLFLIEVEEDRTTRTGRMAQLREAVWPDIFSVPAPKGGVAYVSKDLIDFLETLQ